VSPLARNAAALSVAALLLLAGLGATSQLRYRAQAGLLIDKEQAIVALAAARSAAASVNGPLAVTTWARRAGMVPAPDAPNVEAAAAGLTPPPVPTLPTPWLEVQTVWR
jgi:hypothetical protein